MPDRKNSKNRSSSSTVRLLLNSTEADIWAAEYVRLHGGDESLMRGWFANAIEVGRTAGESAHANRVKGIADA